MYLTLSGGGSLPIVGWAICVYMMRNSSFCTLGTLTNEPTANDKVHENEPTGRRFLETASTQ